MSLESLVSAARENPLVLLLALLVPVLLLVTQSLAPKDKKPLVNLSIEKDNAKVRWLGVCLFVIKGGGCG